MGNRNKKGQFIKGHKAVGNPSPGRPKKKAEDKYLKWMQRRVKKEAWDHIVDVAISRAESGDNKARQWLSDYLMGKPAQQLTVDVVSDLNIILKWPEDADDHDSASGAA